MCSKELANAGELNNEIVRECIEYIYIWIIMRMYVSCCMVYVFLNKKGIS